MKLLVSGSLNYDIYLFVDNFAPPKSVVKQIKNYLGGSGGNAAVSAAKILGKNNVVFLGAVGDDEIAEKHLEDLKASGVETSYVVKVKNVLSGRSFIAVNRLGETAIYSYYGANEFLNVEYVAKVLENIIDKLEGVLIMNPPLEVATFIAVKSKSRNVKVFWDPGTLVRFGMTQLMTALSSTDYFMPNENELITLTGEESLHKSLEALAKVNPKMRIIIKMGAKGSALYSLEGKTSFCFTAAKPESLGLKTVSTSGCGDVYVGVFTALKVLGSSDVEAAIAATCASTIKASTDNPRGGPDLETLNKYLEICRKHINVRECWF